MIMKYSFISRIIFWGQKIKYGKTLQPAYWWGKSPWLLLGLQIFYRCLDRRGSSLDSSLKALVSLRVSQLNHCAFCSDISFSKLEKLNISEQKIKSLSEHVLSLDFTKIEHTVLANADAVTQNTSTEEVLKTLRTLFSEKEVIELTAWIAFQNMSSKFNAALNIPAQGFCTLQYHLTKE